MSRASPVAALAFAIFGIVAIRAEGKPNGKDAEALRLDQQAQRASASGDLTRALRLVEQALQLCEPENACSPKVKGRLHVSLGTLLGVGEGDYTAARREFALALALDSEARLRSLATPELTQAFEDARNGPPNPKPKVDAPDAGVDVTGLFNRDEPPPSRSSEPRHTETAPPPPPEAAPKPRRNWLSLRAMVDFTYLSDANICSPGAPRNYYCTDSTGARYAGHPQPNDDVTSGFGYSTTRLVGGYERVLVEGLTAGAFAGYALRFAPTVQGRKAFFPIHLEGRVMYTFGRDAYADGGAMWSPFVYVAGGLAQFDTHVTVRVNEIPCESTVAPVCQRDLDAYRVLGNAFAALGGGVRMRIEDRYALRAGMRVTRTFGDGGFVLSPEIAYELGF
jgi:hypothetical protein